MFAFTGCEPGDPMAPEIKHAHCTIPRATALGLVGVLHVYLWRLLTVRSRTWYWTANNVHLLDTLMAIPASAERVMGHAGHARWLGVGLLAGCATINT